MRIDILLFFAVAVAGDFVSKEIPSPSTTTRRGEASGPLVDAALEDDLFPATPTAQATSEPVTRYAELEDFSISSEDAGIQVYITFTQAEVRTSDVPIDHTPKSEVNVSQNTTNNIQEMFIYSEKDEIVNTPDLFDDTLEADLLPDVVASYVIPPFDYDTSNSSNSLMGNEAIPEPQENVDSHQTQNAVDSKLDCNNTEPSDYQNSETETPNQQPFDIGSFNPYKHWDLDSEEQERELLMQKFANEISGRDAVPKTDTTETNSQSKKSSGRSYLLLLAGNSTIVKHRQKDFAKYLKLNLAARLSLEYDDVRVNRVVLAPPRLLVNVSVVTPSVLMSDSFDAVEQNAAEIDILKEDVPLHKLAQTNATLLELSGEEYHIVRLLPLFTDPVTNDSFVDCSEGEAAASTLSVEIEFYRISMWKAMLYTSVIGVCVIVVVATVLVTVSQYSKLTAFQWPWRTPKTFSSTPWSQPETKFRYGFERYQPNVIYSADFTRVGVFSKLPLLNEENSAQNDRSGLVELLPPGDFITTTFYSDVVQQSPKSKLHLFGCRPGSVIIPIAPTQSPRKGLSAAKPPLDVRISVDNPNYEK